MSRQLIHHERTKFPTFFSVGGLVPEIRRRRCSASQQRRLVVVVAVVVLCPGHCTACSLGSHWLVCKTQNKVSI